MLGWARKDAWQVNKALDLFGDALEIRQAPAWLIAHYNAAMTDEKMPAHLRTHDGSPEQWQVMMMRIDELRKPMTQEQLNLLAECTALTKGLARRGYEIDKSFDVVITALGFVYDTSPFLRGNVSVELADMAGKASRVCSSRVVGVFTVCRHLYCCIVVLCPREKCDRIGLNYMATWLGLNPAGMSL